MRVTYGADGDVKNAEFEAAVMDFEICIEGMVPTDEEELSDALSEAFGDCVDTVFVDDVCVDQELETQRGIPISRHVETRVVGQVVLY